MPAELAVQDQCYRGLWGDVMEPFTVGLRDLLDYVSNMKKTAIIFHVGCASAISCVAGREEEAK